MFSFSTISVFATLAFGALSSALPLDAPALPALPQLDVVKGALSSVPIPVDALSGVVPRHDVPVGIAAIITTATVKIVGPAQKLQYVNKANATVEACQGPIGEIVDVLTYTIADLKALVGKDLSVILCAVHSTVQITVHDLAVIVAGLLIIVFKALGAVLTIVGATVDKVLFDLLCSVAVLVGEILSVVCLLVGTLVGDLVVIVVGLLAEVIPFILTLNVVTVISLLHIH